MSFNFPFAGESSSVSEPNDEPAQRAAELRQAVERYARNPCSSNVYRGTQGTCGDRKRGFAICP